MIVRLGYVAISNKLGKKATSSSTVTYSNYKKLISDEKKFEKLKTVIMSNLNGLEKHFKYNIENNITTKGEIQLTDALDSVRETYGIRGFVFNGKVYDVGTADNYRETLNTFCRED